MILCLILIEAYQTNKTTKLGGGWLLKHRVALFLILVFILVLYHKARRMVNVASSPSPLSPTRCLLILHFLRVNSDYTQ